MTSLFPCGGRKPILVYKDTPMNKNFVVSCPILCTKINSTHHEDLSVGEEYIPTWYLDNGHIQTIATAKPNPSPRIQYTRQLVTASDGGLLSLDWALHPTKEYRHDHPTILIQHGAGGSSRDRCVRMTVKSLLDKGWRVVAFNLRGCGNTPLTTSRVANGYHTKDIQEVVELLRSTVVPTAPFIGIGFSIGANLMLKYAGEQSHSCPLTAVVSISNVYDLAAFDQTIHGSTWKRHVYSAAVGSVMRSLLFKDPKVMELFSGNPKFNLVKVKETACTIRDFEEQLFCITEGFESVEEYHEKASSVRYMDKISIPTLCISALDDPFCNESTIPDHLCHVNENIFLVKTHSGGHMGFFMNGMSKMWTSDVLVDYFQSILRFQQLNQAQVTLASYEGVDPKTVYFLILDVMTVVAVAPISYLQQNDTRRKSSVSQARYASAGKRLSTETFYKIKRASVLASVFMFLCTLGLIFLSFFMLSLLISHGMFDRHIVNYNSQTQLQYWAPYGQSCKLNASGFIPESCDAHTLSVIPEIPFNAVGKALAQQWYLEIQEAHGILYVTSCVVGGTANVGWTDLQFVAGYDYFPECLPTSPQDVAGMAMLETTIRHVHDDALYLLTLYSDLDPSMTQFMYENTDGTKQRLISNPRHTLITEEGIIEVDDVGTNYIIKSKPLGSRYLVTSYCVTVIEDLSDLKKELDLTGWSQGKHTKVPVVPGWNCGHRVSNANELIILQAVFSCLSLWLFAGDIYLTAEGLRGLLTGKPVLKYTILSGLERRKWLLICMITNSLPGLLYMDVSRIYYFTANGFQIWVLSAAMVANFFTLGWIFLLSILDGLVSFYQTTDFCIGYSSPVFIFSSLIWLSFQWCNMEIFSIAFNKFYSAPPFLGFNVYNETWPSGSYVAEGTPPVLTMLISNTIQSLAIAFLVSVLVSTVHRRIFCNKWFISTKWCRDNSLLHRLKLPSCITALPLDASSGIKMGNKVYCKPSTLALMGFSTIIEKEMLHAESHINQLSCSVVSVYSLVVALIQPGWCRAFGRIQENKFSAEKNKLHGETQYIHTRGPCVM